MSKDIRSMRDQLKAPEILVEAAKRGERIRSPHASRSDTTGTHIRRFSTAIAVYACIAVLLLVSVTLLPVLLESSPGDQHSETTPIDSAPMTTPDRPATTTRPSSSREEVVFTTDPNHIPATPMTNEDVEDWMNSHRLLNDKIDKNSYFCSRIGFYADGGMANLFDDIFTAEEWKKAEQEGRFEAATYTDRVDTNGDGVIGYNEETGETDRWVELGHMSYDINAFALHWSMTEPVTLGSYVVYTDTEYASRTGSPPVGWTLYATNDDALAAKPADTVPYLCTSESALRTPKELEAAGWVRIDYVFDANMKEVDCMPYGYKIDAEDQKAYKHYCWFLDEPGEDGIVVGITGLKLYAADSVSTDPQPPTPETPMAGEDVESYMNSHRLLNDKIDRNSYFASPVGFTADGGMANLFDDIFTAEEWQKAEREGRFEAATYTDRVDTNYDGVIGLNEETGEIDRWVELGQMTFSGTTGAFFWAMNEPVILDAYVIYTGIDAAERPYRNPVGWTLFATNDDALGAKPADAIPYHGSSHSALKDYHAFLDAGWVLLDDVFDSNMDAVSAAPYGYKIDEAVQGAYKYYCWFYDYGGDGGIISTTGMKLYAAENDASSDAPSPDTPMAGEDVESYMNSHRLLNDKIEPFSCFASDVEFTYYGGMENLFDDIFTAEEWQKAEQEGRFEDATISRNRDYFDEPNADGIIGRSDKASETDTWVALGKMSFYGSTAALY